MPPQKPINRAGSWWSRRDDGSWSRWNAFTEQWEDSPSAPPPPTPPPTPGPRAAKLPASTATVTKPGPPPPGAVAAPRPRSGSRRHGFDLGRIRHMLPHWAEGPLGVTVAVGLVVILMAGSGMAYSMITKAPPKRYAPIEVEPYDGPVAWRGQKDVYARLKKITGCTPQDIQGVDRNFNDVRTAKGRVKYIVDGVRGMRGLETAKAPKMNFLKQAELGRQVARIVNKEYDRAKSNLDATVLAMLGAVPPGTRFGKLSGADAAASIAGLYVPEKGELYVGEAGGFNMLDELTLAHELQHAFADQTFGLGDHDLDVISDERNAMKALAEGDAELTAAHYDMVLDIESTLQFRETSAEAQAATGAEYPGYFVERGFFFPYFEGTLFVCELYAINGWEAVNDAYTDPPRTTAEILFPERYIFKIEPKDPTDPATPTGWNKEDAYSLGAADLLWLFQAPSGRLQPRLMRNAQPVKRWNGGEVHVFRRGKDTAISMALVDGGEDPKGKKASPTLCKRVNEWYSTAFDDARKKRVGRTVTWRHDRRVATLVCTKEGPRLSIAPDARTSAALSR
jgi:hypothetical protein